MKYFRNSVPENNIGTHLIDIIMLHRYLLDKWNDEE